MEHLLFEHIHGYGLFKLKQYEDMQSNEQSGLYNDISKLRQYVSLCSYFKFTDTEAIETNLDLISQNLVSDALKEFLRTNEVKILHCDKSLNQAITSIGIKPKQSWILMRAIRHNQNKLLKIEENSQDVAILACAHDFSRKKISYNIKMEDNLIIQSSYLIEQLSKDIDSYFAKLVRIYDNYLPEIRCYSNDKLKYVKICKILGKIDGDMHQRIKAIKKEFDIDFTTIIKFSIGSAIKEADFINIEMLINILDEKLENTIKIEEYLKDKLSIVAPNLQALLGDLMAAKIIAQAGGLLTLSKYPSSTVQVLGAEAALFRALKTKTATPKHGFLFNSDFLLKTHIQHKGRIARFLASKISLASKIDYFGEQRTNLYGVGLRKLVMRKIKSLDSGKEVRRTDEVLEKIAAEIAKLDNPVQ